MIGKIKGDLEELSGNLALVETKSGISYFVYLTPGLTLKYKIGDSVDIYVHHHIREDTQSLFGFELKREYELFKLLLSISGIGARIAYSIISFSTPQEIEEAVSKNDVDFFSKVPGLGRKTAIKIILELSSKLETEFALSKMYVSEDEKIVIDALVSLGFKSAEVKKIIPDVKKDLPVEERIKEAIRIATGQKSKV